MSASSPAATRPASTVVVLRDAPSGFEVLLVRRSDHVAFMAGACVFPGGRVDEADRTAAPASVGGATSRFADLSMADEWTFRVAAARELQEEVSLDVSVETLIPIAHWVTPEIEIRRYDTRFFVTTLPEGQIARHDDSETTELLWLAPTAALDLCRRGDVRLPPPTWTTLRRLEKQASIADVLQWAHTTPIVRVQPGFVEMEGQRVLTLPGDPSFPTFEGWDVPDETRFVLQDGGAWIPIRG